MKHGKRFLSLALALVMVFSLTTGASAAAREQVTAYLNYNLTIQFNGEAKLLGNVNGDQVYPITYGGTTYVPVRAISNLLGLEVGWDQERQEVTLRSSSDAAKPIVVKPDTPKKTGTETIRPVIDPGIKVWYDGAYQKMKTVKGEPVYPMLNGGTTYLPIRAVGDMLGLEVGWEQATQTVTLDFPEHVHDPNKIFDELRIDSCKFTVYYKDGTKELFGLDEIDDVFKITPDNFSKKYLEALVQEVVNGIDMVYNPIKDVEASSDEDVKVFSGTHIGRDWVEIDWTGASKGYITVKVKDLPDPDARVGLTAKWFDGRDSGGTLAREAYKLTEGEWNIPLYGSSAEYAIEAKLYRIVDANTIASYKNELALTAKFKAEVTDTEAIWTLSTPRDGLDFENAPKTCAKALEITKNCKTDAEKITAVFNWVSSNIKYDHAMAADNVSKASYKLDDILDGKTGICGHYAYLMVGMLRSLGIPCKYVGGFMYANGKWEGHAWVAVKPKTGNLNIPGMGKDGKWSGPDATGEFIGTGWIRLDPTNAHTPTTTANDKKYIVNAYE